MSWRKLGARIKKYREDRGLSQAALAERAGLSRIYIQKLELGDKVNPSFDALERIARALRVRLLVDLIEQRED
jgi:transcriptional regulator with XRE-family HTH domain